MPEKSGAGSLNANKKNNRKKPVGTTGLFRVMFNYTARVTLPLRRQRVQA